MRLNVPLLPSSVHLHGQGIKDVLEDHLVGLLHAPDFELQTLHLAFSLGLNVVPLCLHFRQLLCGLVCGKGEKRKIAKSHGNTLVCQDLYVQRVQCLIFQAALTTFIDMGVFANGRDGIG